MRTALAACRLRFEYDVVTQTSTIVHREFRQRTDGRSSSRHWRSERALAATAAAVKASARIPYGACVRRDQLDTEVDYRATLLTHCQQVTPEGGLYWYDLRPTRQQFKFDYPDSVLAFAEANGMAMRGHTLVWYGAMPDWTKDIRSAGEAERELTTHIERVVSRYRGKIKTWHVVNEPIDDTKGPFPACAPASGCNSSARNISTWRFVLPTASIPPPSFCSMNTISRPWTAPRRNGGRPS